jgi:2-octaprenyl-6-methoxyphenol hydroxylase
MDKPPAPADLATDIIVVGAGPVGSSLAILCAKAGFETILIDTRDPGAAARKDTRTFAIVRGSWRLLGAAGVHDAMQGEIQPLNGLEAVDGGTHIFGAPSVTFGTDDLADSLNDEPLGQMVPAGTLQAALDTCAAEAEHLTRIAPAWFETVETGPGYARVTLADGRTIDAQLVAACDGVNSPVREALGIQTQGRDYQQSVFAADVQLEREHGGIARQLFTPQGPFATLPLPNNRANLAWYMKTGAAETLAKCEPSEIEAELNAKFSEFAGPMTLIGAPGSYPLHLKMAEAMIGPRAALLGDAARRINPLAGQGLNLGFKDVGALVDVIVEARSVGLDIGSAVTLENYSVWRRFDAASTAMFLDGIDRAFSNDSSVLKPLRGLALTLADRAGPIRRAMARQASADSDKLPSLMQA